MARVTDLNKIKNLETAAVELINNKGYGNTTVAAIAKAAGVSTGYLYSHYSSKEELVRTIWENAMDEFDGHIDSSIEKFQTVHEAARHYFEYMFNQSNEHSEMVKFIILLVYENAFAISKKRLKNTADQCRKLLTKGLETGELNKDVTAEEVFLIFVSLPMKLVETRLSGISKKKNFSQKDVEKMLRVCMNAVQ